MKPILFTIRNKSLLPGFVKGLGSEKRLGRLSTRLEDCRRGIGEFGRRQKNVYYIRREAELKEIIALLTQTIAAFYSENREHNRSILEQSQRMEQLIRLDHMQGLNPGLLQAVEELRAFVCAKEARDGEKFEKLYRQAATLGAQLEDACTEPKRDGLTGALSRHAFDHVLDRLIADNRVKPQQFALLILDIDDFKRINAAYSHLIGDNVLTTIAKTCRQTLGTDSLLARYGGEEFAILLPEASITHGIAKGRAICAAIASAGCHLEGISCPEAFSLTVSIGVSACRRHDTAEALVGRADQALSLAKRTGKNRVMSEKDLSAGVR